MVTTASADSVLRSYYLDAVAEQLNKAANPFLAAIEQTTSDVWGKDVRKAAVYGVHGGVGAGTEEGSLPATAGGGKAAGRLTGRQGAAGGGKKSKRVELVKAL